MKLKFFLLTLLLLFARGCDFYSTSLWIFRENGLRDELNPLARWLDFSWNGLVIANLLITGLLIGLCYYYYFHYRPRDLEGEPPANYREYASRQYFGRPDRFFQVFYQMPTHKGILAAHLGYVLTRVIILASLLATVHNLGQFYQLEFYQAFRKAVGRPSIVIYGLSGAAGLLIYLQLLRREFAIAQKKLKA